MACDLTVFLITLSLIKQVELHKFEDIVFEDSKL